MSDRYDDDLSTYDDEVPEESTRPTSSTPVKPGDAYPRIREQMPPPGSTPARGSQPVSRTRRATGDHDSVSQGSQPYADPNPPRAERQSRPMPPPPPIPPQGYAVQEPRTTQPRSRPRPQAPRSKRDSGLYLPWWSLLIMLIFVGGAAIGVWLVVESLGGDVPAGGRTPMVVVVTATFTVGPPASPTAVPAPPTGIPPAILPTVVPTPTLPPGDFKIGSTVEVIGDVGIAGLNIRSGPGTSAAIRYQAPAGSRFVLKSGPQYASDLEWWELEDPTNPQIGGWAARQFLRSVPSQ